MRMVQPMAVTSHCRLRVQRQGHSKEPVIVCICPSIVYTHFTGKGWATFGISRRRKKMLVSQAGQASALLLGQRVHRRAVAERPFEHRPLLHRRQTVEGHASHRSELLTRERIERSRERRRIRSVVGDEAVHRATDLARQTGHTGVAVVRLRVEVGHVGHDTAEPVALCAISSSLANSLHREPGRVAIPEPEYSRLP